MRAEESFAVRRAACDELDEVAAVWHESAARMGGADPAMPTQKELRVRIEAELRSGWSLFVAATLHEIWGILAIKAAEGVLDQLFVRFDRENHGVGARLLGEARRQMPGGFTLRMAADNNRAGRFYRNNGLSLLRTDVHPRHGRPVEFYGWNVR